MKLLGPSTIQDECIFLRKYYAVSLSAVQHVRHLFKHYPKRVAKKALTNAVTCDALRKKDAVLDRLYREYNLGFVL